MTAYTKQHEKYVQERIASDRVDLKLLAYHQLRIQWLQHERLVHLLVFLFTLAGTLTFFVLSYLNQAMWLIIVFLIMLVLSVFYCIHYYFLENTVQRWYVLADEMKRMIDSSGE